MMTFAKRDERKMNNRLLMLLLMTILGCTTIQAFKTNNLPVEIEPDKQVAVKFGQSQIILCKVPVALQVCRFNIPGQASIVLTKNQAPEDGIEYYGEGLDKGQCGVKISSIEDSHDGNITCNLTPDKGRTEISNSVRLIVAKPPNNPELHLNKNTYKSGEKMDVSCIVDGGRPPANVSLFLDDESIGYDDRALIYGRPIDDSRAVLNTSRSVNPNDNGKNLICVATHLALAQPKKTQRQITVVFAPQPQQTIEYFGYGIGRPGKVNVTVHANPMPTFTWMVGEEKIAAGQTDLSGRLQTSSAIDLGRGYWSVDLTIDSVQKSDTDKEYSLRADNAEGFAIYKIHLSSSNEPPTGVELDAGSIIGIVVGVLLLILAVFLIVFARATGRWCFAGGSDKRNIGESSDTESTGRFSRTEVDAGKTSGGPKLNFMHLFRQKKDKVSGADTDTMRTVVTMDDEKMPSSEATTVAETPTRNDAGIVYAELDLAQSQQPPGPRRLSEEKTEYAEILYTKPEGQEAADK